ncbi:hypothetical protein [Treponema maltophilum]|uniref:hypothetical protein n=1 Tax=Treponema maltophilum TaxID=51160 RepID=UPI003D929EF6
MVQYWDSAECRIISFAELKTRFNADSGRRLNLIDAELQKKTDWTELVDITRLEQLMNGESGAIKNSDMEFLILRLQGTDGIRAEVSVDTCCDADCVSLFLKEKKLTAVFCYRYIKAFVSQLGVRAKSIVLGEDGRDFFSRTGLKHAITDALSESGVDTIDLGITPVPAIAAYSYLNNIPGIMLTASHNPARFNGLKLFINGHKLYPTGRMGENSLSFKTVIGEELPGATPGTVIKKNAVEILEWLIRRSPVKIRNNSPGQTIVLDAANGAYSQFATDCFRKLGFNVVNAACNPGRGMINKDCSVAPLEELERSQDDKSTSATVRQLIETGRKSTQRRMFAVVFDGDGDRAFILSYNKENDKVLIHDGDEIGYLIAESLKGNSGSRYKGVFYSTVESDFKLGEQVSRKLGYNNKVVCVGDRWLSKNYNGESLFIGCERSGHIVFPVKEKGRKDCLLTGNGLVTALLAIEEIGRLPDDNFLEKSENIRISIRSSKKELFFRGSSLFKACRLFISEHNYFIAIEKIFNDDTDMLFFNLEKNNIFVGCLYVRKSGTEPKISVSLFVERVHIREANILIEKIGEIIEKNVK